MCAEICSLWPGLLSLGCEEWTVLQDVCWGRFGQVWFLLAVKRRQSGRMCSGVTLVADVFCWLLNVAATC